MALNTCYMYSYWPYMALYTYVYLHAMCIHVYAESCISSVCEAGENVTMACFIKNPTVESVKDIELGNPFLRMKIFPLFGVESKHLTLEDVPEEFRPYPGCIFVSLRRRSGGCRG